MLIPKVASFHFSSPHLTKASTSIYLHLSHHTSILHHFTLPTLHLNLPSLFLLQLNLTSPYQDLHLNLPSPFSPYFISPYQHLHLNLPSSFSPHFVSVSLHFTLQTLPSQLTSTDIPTFSPYLHFTLLHLTTQIPLTTSIPPSLHLQVNSPFTSPPRQFPLHFTSTSIPPSLHLHVNSPFTSPPR